jgi:hypothetical protein
MGLFSERFAPAWVVQFYSGLKAIFYAASLGMIPFELRAGHPFNHLPYTDFPETGWRLGLRLVTLAFWLIVFFWAGGKLWPSTTREKGKRAEG